MKSFSPAFSVIVPMYNVEKYLCKCVDSIRDQSLKDIEIILVDDGSPDRCGEIADEYAKVDNRVKVVHRSNGGLGPARNSGIEVATGEYIGFVDSDDWVEADMFEKLYQAAKEHNSDIVFTGLKIIRHGELVSTYVHPFAGMTLNGQEEIFSLRSAFYGALPSKVLDNPVPTSVWVGGYRNKLIKDNALRFIDIRSEDKFFNTCACRAANVVTCISGVPYCYRKDDQPSITKTFNPRTIDSFFNLFRSLEDLVDEEPLCYRDECCIRLKRCIVDYCRVLIGMIELSIGTEKEKNERVKKVIENPSLREACTRFPWWRVPFQQGVFFLTLKFRSVFFSRKILQLRNLIY